MNSVNNSWFDAVIKYRWWVLVLTAVFTWLTASGVGGLVKRSDYRSFMDPEYPGMVELDEIEAIFTETNNAFIVVVPDDGNVFNLTTLEAIREITADGWLLPYASRVSSVTNYQYTEADGDDLSVNNLVPEFEDITDDVARKASRIARSENDLNGLLVSEKQHVAAVDVNFEFQDGEILAREQAEVAAALKALAAKYEERYPHIQIKLAGSTVIDYVADEYSGEVNSVQMPMMLAIMAVWLLLLLRSFWGTVVTFLVVILTGVTTMGVFGHIKMEIDGVTAISPIVIMTLAVADSVHVIAGVRNGMRNGLDRTAAIIYSLKLNITPVFLTSATTVLGVITFSFSDFPSLRKLGLIIALGVTIAFVLSVTLLPALLSMLPMRAPKIKEGAKPTRLIFQIYSDWMMKHYRAVLIVAVVVCIASTAMLPKIVINESFEVLFDDSTPEQQAILFMKENMSGFMSMEVAIFGQEPGSLNDPAFLKKVEEFKGWVEQQKGVEHVSSITDTFRRLNQNMHGDDPEYYKLPEDKELAAQYLLLYEMSLPYGLDINNQIDQDKKGTRLKLMLKDLNSGENVALKQSIRDWFSREAPDLRVVPTGIIPLMAEMGYVHMIPNMMKGGIIAILMVSLVLLFALRSWRLGLFATIANIVPITIGYGLWAVTHGMVNFAVMSVAGICLGVVVDFAVHFLNKYQQGYKIDNSVETGVRYAFDKVSYPLMTTMVVLVSGFWVLASTPFHLVGELGLLTGEIILLALIFNLVVLPALLLTVGKKFRTV